MRSLRVKLTVALAFVASTVISAATPLRLGVPQPDNIQYLSLWVALGAGYFKSEGLDVQLVYAERANQSGELLLGNRADVALLQPPAYLGLIAERRPIVLFANLLANDPINLVVRPDVAARLKLDPDAPLAERLRALKGLRVGVANEPTRRLRVLFAQAGLDADRDIKMTNVPGDEQVAAFRDGIVDALYCHTPYLQEVLVNGKGVLTVNQSGGEIPTLSNGQVHSLVATRDYVAAHPEVIRAVTRAIARAQALIHRDADAAAAAMVKAGITTPTPQHLSTIVGLYRAAVPATPKVSAAAVERNATLYPARPATPDFAKIHAADYVATEFADEVAAAP